MSIQNARKLFKTKKLIIDCGKYIMYTVIEKY